MARRSGLGRGLGALIPTDVSGGDPGSGFREVPVGAMAATIVLSVVSQVLDSLPQLEWLHPWLFSHYWFGFADLLREPISWVSFQDNAMLQAGYVLVFGALAYGRFATKDVLS